MTGGQWYKVNDVYKYCNTLYRVINGHTSSGAFTESDTLGNVVEYLQSFNFETNPTFTIDVTVTDKVGNQDTASFTILLIDPYNITYRSSRERRSSRLFGFIYYSNTLCIIL